MKATSQQESAPAAAAASKMEETPSDSSAAAAAAASKPEETPPNDFAAAVAASKMEETANHFYEDDTEIPIDESSSSFESQKHDGFALKETRKIRNMRLFVFFVLIFSVGGALAVFFYLHSLETAKFEGTFIDEGTKLMASLGATLYFTLGTVDALVVNLVSHAEATNQTWPFVTIPDFGIRAGKVKDVANAHIINIYTHVNKTQRKEWENYTTTHNSWVRETMGMQAKDSSYTGPISYDYLMYDVIHDYSEYDKPEEEQGKVGTDRPGPWLVYWQCMPVVASYAIYNWDLMSWYRPSIESLFLTHRVFLSDAYMIAYPNDTEKIKENEAEAEWTKLFLPPDANPLEPVSDIQYPIISDATNTMNLFQDGDYDPKHHQLGGILSLSFYWRELIKNILPPGSNGIIIVFENPCNPAFAYMINGPAAEYLGTGDFNDSKFGHLQMESDLLDLKSFAIKNSAYSGIPVADDVCPFYVRVYPSEEMEARFMTPTPIILSASAALVFLLFAGIFIVYDMSVERRQRTVMNTAVRSAAIVSSLFPESVTKRMMQDDMMTSFISQNQRLKSYLDGHDGSSELTAKPIADVFPYTTVLFGDVAGFTAWSSTRDPSQVFMLLETIYKAFDNLARQCRVFKVETVGDCYVAVTGLPNPQAKHALIMARFATECLFKFKELVKSLEKSLGPDTSDLGIRIGLHSGPVTAGVLRGEKSRFQLFGDTVNTTARLESTGMPNKIHISNITAQLLIEAGNEHWLEKRTDEVTAKGKGVLETYWLLPKPSNTSSTSSEHDASEWIGNFSTSSSPTLPQNHLKKHMRLITWVSDMLLCHIMKVIARHEGMGLKLDPPAALSYRMPQGTSYVDEVVEVIKLPEFDKNAAARAKSVNEIKIDGAVINQLRSVVSAIAAAYMDNPFHNFEHACHVTMSVDKFLQRIVAPDIEPTDVTNKTNFASHLHDYTHGITSDPLTILGILFSALIHDVDHRGVSNQQLATEEELMAQTYRNKSIAEQNSLDVAWGILMQEEYSELRSAIFCTRSEMMRFRQVVVNIVMATDIFDKEFNDLRKSRWQRAFSGQVTTKEEENDLRATIVIEHIMQASDVSHTMQHWHVYRKWNERLFTEMYKAFKAGRMARDPSEFWYQGEIGFFDNYILPLAQKLRDCKVFGVSSDEVLNYAQVNRAEWAAKGQEVVASMIEKIQTKEKEAMERSAYLQDEDTRM